MPDSIDTSVGQGGQARVQTGWLCTLGSQQGTTVMLYKGVRLEQMNELSDV